PPPPKPPTFIGDRAFCFRCGLTFGQKRYILWHWPEVRYMLRIPLIERLPERFYGVGKLI
ncbi:MAG: hypothetical protein IJU70_11285, partial [Lentisphaeria bacterium]|nr:hypothetical protein [Lentisphaeria bacterium]